MYLVYPLSVSSRRIWKQYRYVKCWRVKEVLYGLGGLNYVKAAIFLG